jgi:hypothetical protein
VVVPPGDAAAIREALLSFYALWTQKRLGLPPNPGVQVYEYRSLARRLAACFDTLVR